MNNNKVMIYGGSFSPPHMGHLQTVDYVFSSHNCDKVIIIPCHKHAWGKKLADFDYRMEHLEMMFSEHIKSGKVEISDIERELGDINYIYLTVQEIVNRYPDHSIGLIIGSDLEPTIDTWEYIDYIRSAAEIIVIPRGIETINTSSTKIREIIQFCINHPHDADMLYLTDNLHDAVFLSIMKEIMITGRSVYVY
jgi:nicotinate-nucleotide adenylyltransferase